MTSTVLIALLTGVVASVISSWITARQTIGDRSTRIQIAKEDRESAQRREACLVVAQRIQQWDIAVALRNQGKPIGEVKQDRDFRSEAGVSLLLSNAVLEALKDVNGEFQSFASSLSLRSQEERDTRALADHWAKAVEYYDTFQKDLEKLRGLLRMEIVTFPSASCLE